METTLAYSLVDSLLGTFNVPRIDKIHVEENPGFNATLNSIVYFF